MQLRQNINNRNSMKNILIIFSICLLMYSCNSSNNPLIKVTVNGKDVPQLNIRDIDKETSHFNFSNILENVEFIKIETREDIPIKKGSWLIGKKYLICASSPNKSIIQFSRDGKFIRKLVSYGKGPKEASGIFKFYFDTNEDHLLLSCHDKKNNLTRFNLKTGKFKDFIPLYKACRVTSFLVNDKNEIIIIPSFEGEIDYDYDIYTQNMKGELINAVKGGIPPINFNTSGNLLIPINKQIHYHPLNCDTIYKYDFKKLIPAYIIEDGDNDSPFQKKKAVGNMDYFKIFETPGYIIFQTSEVLPIGMRKQKVINVDFPGMKVLIHDKISGESRFFDPFYNDYVGKEIFPFRLLMNFGFKQNGIYVEVFDAGTIIETAEKIKTNPEIQIKDRDLVIKLGESLSENDNPVLLIGKIKNNINF